MIDFKGRTIQAEEVIAALKKEMQLKEICRKISCQKIINQAAEERGISVTAEEIQAEADALRHEKHLFRASETHVWLSDQLITAEDWESGIRDRLLTKKLSHHLFAQDVEKFFTENQLNFDQILLYRIVVPYEKLAQEIFYQIQEGEISFYEAAHIYDIEPRRQYNCGYEGKFYRWNLKPDLSALIFSASPGHVVGPLLLEEASHLLLIEEFIPAELTADLYQEILKRMFDEWLITELNYVLNA